MLWAVVFMWWIKGAARIFETRIVCDFPFIVNNFAVEQAEVWRDAYGAFSSS